MRISNVGNLVAIWTVCKKGKKELHDFFKFIRPNVAHSFSSLVSRSLAVS